MNNFDSRKSHKIFTQKNYPNNYDNKNPLGSKTAIYKIKTVELTGKENPIQLQKLFYPGKTSQNDISN
jgi:hypothetical protein